MDEKCVKISVASVCDHQNSLPLSLSLGEFVEFLSWVLRSSEHERKRETDNCNANTSCRIGKESKGKNRHSQRRRTITPIFSD